MKLHQSHSASVHSKVAERTLFLCRAAMIAALYVVLTMLANALGLASGAIQLRFSEALCILPYFTPAAIPGLYIGCLLANLVTGAMPLDIVLGPLATLAGAFGAYALRRVRGGKWLVSLPNILANTAVLPFVIYFCYTDPSEPMLGSVLYLAATVFAGEVLSCFVLGTPLLFALRPVSRRLFGSDAPCRKPADTARTASPDTETEQRGNGD